MTGPGAIPAEQLAAARAALPRMRPVTGNWLTVDSAYAAQVAEKRRLVAERNDDVLWQPGGAAQEELVAVVLAEVADHPGFDVEGRAVHCPDGRTVKVCGLADLAAVVQEDLCLLEKTGGAWVLTAGLLGFPASWSLHEKAGRPLRRIHRPVPDFDESTAARVDRLFDGLQPGRPLWRANLLAYDDPALFQPRTEDGRREVGNPDSRWWRSERQTLVRLPETGAVLFAIHTMVVPRRPGGDGAGRTGQCGTRKPESPGAA